MSSVDARERERGFTLLEVLIALGLTIVILTGLADGVFRSLTTSRLAREDTRATLEASTQLEKLLRAPFSASDWTAGAHQFTTGVYTVRWFVAVDTPGPGARAVSVTAGRTGAPRVVRLATVRAR